MSAAPDIDTSWRRPRSQPALAAGDVHVWAVRVDLPRACRDGLVLTLSPEERRRERAFASAAARNRFVARRGLLRMLVARYAGCEPGGVELRAAPTGKLELVWPRGANALDVSCSSSGGLALVAVARERAIGVDVERVRAVYEPLELARSILSEQDWTAIAALPARCRHEAFLRRWTWTEAHLKARGDGLAGLGGRFGVHASSSGRRLALGGGYVGAVAAEGIGWRLRCWQW